MCTVLLAGITLVDEAKGDNDEDETAPKLVAGVQLAYSKRRPQRKVLSEHFFYRMISLHLAENYILSTANYWKYTFKM